MSDTKEPRERRATLSEHQTIRDGLLRKVGITALTVLLVSAVGVVVTKGITKERPGDSREQVSGLGSAGSPERAAVPEPTPVGPAMVRLQGDFEELQMSIDGEIGLVVRPLGGRGSEIVLGTWTSGPAWSTMKVPLAVAALRDEPEPIVSENMVAAVERSDNYAADALWRGLGDPTTAARKVEAVLRDSGDNTIVQDKKIRTDNPELSAFGQTIWPLTEQARFIASAACDQRNDQIFGLMAHVAADQSWGLGQIRGSRFKGGWGPSTSGEYLVRQMGILQTPSGQAAVALAVEPASGSFAAGTEALDKIADWMARHEEELPSGECV